MTPIDNLMNLIPTTANGLLNPAAAALVALIMGLWINQFMKDWRWQPLLLLGLSIATQWLWHFLAVLPATREMAFQVLWFGFLGASIAVFGQETIYNMVGMLNIGPRSTRIINATLRDRPWY